MKRISLAILAILFALCVFRIPPASAAMWLVEAWRADSGGSVFSVEFNDDNNDGKVEFKDIQIGSFSGVYLTEGKDRILKYTSIVGIPDLEIPDSGTPLLTLGAGPEGKDYNDKFWYFSRLPADETSRPVQYWDYYTATLVPIPRAVLLLGSGLIGFIGLRRRLVSR